MAEVQGGSTASSEWLRGWRVVVAAVAGMAIGSLHAYSMGVMVGPLEQEFGWTRAQITSGMVICSVMSVLFAPFFGMFIDRFGPRRIGLFGIAIYGIALASLSLASASIVTWWLLWTFVAVALLNTKPTVWVSAVSGLFERSRGLALAVVLSATGISQALTPIITFMLVEKFGWRTAYVVLGAGGALLALPILWFWLSSLQDRSRVAPVSDAAGVKPLPGISARDGFRSSAFWRLAVAALAMGLAGGALTLNLVPMLTTSGLTLGSAAALAGLSGMSSLVGRLGGGHLLDRFNARLVGGGAVLLPVATCLCLLFAADNHILVTMGIVLSGLAAGAEMDAIAYMASRSFGFRNFGLLFGTLSGVLALGVGSGPTLANLVYDLTGSYQLVLWAILPLAAITSFMFLGVGPYPNFDAGADNADAGEVLAGLPA